MSQKVMYKCSCGDKMELFVQDDDLDLEFGITPYHQGKDKKRACAGPMERLS